MILNKLYWGIPLCFFFSSVQIAFGQNNVLDSLRSLLPIESNDSIKAEVLAEIGDLYYDIDFDSTVYYYKEAISLSQEIPYFSIELSSWRSLGYVYSFRKNDFEKSLEFFKKALELGTVNADSVAMAYVLSDMGRIYWKQGKSFEALDFHLKVKEIGEKIEASKVILRANLSLGIIENENGNNDKAKEYYQKALQSAISLNKDRSIGLIYNNLGKAHQDDKEYDIALDYLRQADSIFTVLGDNLRLSLVAFNKGKNYALQGFLEEGVNYYQLALKLNESYDNKEREVMISSGLAIAYQKLGQLNQSIAIAENALSILKEIDTKLYYDELYTTLGESYELVGDRENSFQYLKRAVNFKNENGKLEEVKKIASLNHLYELQKKENKILELKTVSLEKDKAIKESSYYFNLISFVSVILGLLLLLTFLIGRLNEIKRFEKLKNKLADDLHDNIGTSLNHIKMLSRRMKNENVALAEKESIAAKIKNISDELLYNMHDMVWSLDKKKETIGDLLERIQDHADVSLGDFDIPYKIDIDVSNKDVILKTKEKVNTYLIFKESINNILKHTKTINVSISISQKNAEHFNIYISNFYGIKKTKEILSNQRGLKSMKARAAEIGGKLNVVDKPGNFIIEFQF